MPSPRPFVNQPTLETYLNFVICIKIETRTLVVFLFKMTDGYINVLQSRISKRK